MHPRQDHLRLRCKLRNALQRGKTACQTPSGSGGTVSTLLGALRAAAGAILGLATSELEAPPSAEASKSGRTLTTVALVAVMLLFVALPQLAAAGSSRLLGMDIDIRSPVFQVIMGMFNLFIVLGYMMVMRFAPDLRCVFGVWCNSFSTEGLPCTAVRPSNRTTPTSNSRSIPCA